jgi:hypothetical protein
MAGYDTAGEIQNTYASAHSEFGADPSFWVRYFNPSPAADLFENDPVSECQGAWASGGNYVGCISAPTQSRLSGSAAEAQADAQSYAAALLSAYQAVGPLLLPSSKQLWCFLDQEYSTSLSSAYWNAWANYIADYNFDGLGTYPLYPCLYCDPGSPYPNCSTIAGSSGVDVPAAIWSSEPEPCGNLTNPPGWDADSCSAAPTLLWQYGEQGACGYSANVDLDYAAPGHTMSSYCFDVSSNP